MLGISMKMLRDEHEAEDLVSEVFWEIWQKPDRFAAERGAPRTYLLLVVRSRSIDRLRSRKAGTAGRTQLGTTPDAASDHPGPDQVAEHRETRDLIRRLLDALPENQRQAVSMSFFDGLTHQEIADRTGDPLGTVKGRVRRGLIQLRDALRKHREGVSS